MTERIDLDYLRQWVGRSETSSDVVTEQLVEAYRATLQDSAEKASAGETAPLGVHWCLAPPIAPLSALGPDGHPLRGGFLPPVPLPRRMWAGGRMRFVDALRVGDRIDRVSTIAAVTVKTGASGPLCFVTIEHVILTERGEALREEQDLVFRAAAGRATAQVEGSRGANPPLLPASDLVRKVEVSPVLLFRFSALTFNGHRIHYDRLYATEVEGYGGLVAHAPLQAALLLGLAAEMRDGAGPRRFDFRALRPLVEPENMVLAGRWRSSDLLDLSSASAAGAPSLTATASWGDGDPRA